MTAHNQTTNPATENKTLPLEVAYELIQTRNIIGLATFAVEARRVLNEIDLMAQMLPDLRGALGRVEARCQWSEYPDALAAVLDDVYDRLGRLMGED